MGFRGHVETDASFRAFLTTLQNHKETCAGPTWNSMIHYAQKLKAKNIRIAFFSSTPQGGGVALMRHALVRFSRLAGVDLNWYGMFRIYQISFVCTTDSKKYQSQDQVYSASPRTSTISSRV